MTERPINLDRVREVIRQTMDFVNTFETVTVTDETRIIAWLVDQVDEAQAHIDSACEHLQAVISDPRYVGTHVQAEAERALYLLNGEPDGADQ